MAQIRDVRAQIKAALHVGVKCCAALTAGAVVPAPSFVLRPCPDLM